MDFLINESQLKLILSEEDRSELGGYLKELKLFTKQIVSRVLKSYNINLRMMMTWATSVGGLVMPLDQYIKSGNFNISEEQRMLVLAGIAFTLYFETKKPIVKLFNTIKDEGLEEIYIEGLRKGSQLKKSFLNFMTSINVSVGSFMDTVAYSFLIPIIMDIQSVASRTSDPKEASMLIAERLVASGVILIGAQVLTRVIKKIIDRIT